MKKVVRIGTAKTYGGRGYSIFCKIEFKEGQLSISGVEGPTQGGNCLGGCGQIEMHLKDHLDTITPAPGWTRPMLRQFFDIWDRWHLNDMKAGSAIQENYLREHPLDPESYKYPKSHYEVASEVLAQAGLNPDPDGYKYGHAWKREEVPQAVIDFLASLPDTDKQPAWV
jgi:hypothetical protein